MLPGPLLLLLLLLLLGPPYQHVRGVAKLDQMEADIKPCTEDEWMGINGDIVGASLGWQLEVRVEGP